PPLPLRGDAARASADWATAAGRWAPRLQGLDIRRELEVLERLGGSLVLPGDPWWPSGLNDLVRPPHCLWVRGDPALLASRAGADDAAHSRTREDLVPAGPGSGHALALVGARASTDYGEHVTVDMASGLAAKGVVVISGGAFGIDAAAHRGALRTGATVSVSAGGVDRLYPAGNADVLEEVITTGALVAEVPPGCQPGRHRFLTRNRLIAAMSEATVVVEAAWRSGALSTAHHALELGRPVGAVPGPVTSMASVGCHRLLRQGAVCVTDAEEALELVTPLGATDPDSAKAADPANAGSGLLDGLDGPEAAVLDALPARGDAAVESIARAAGLAERETIAALGLLELAGRVERRGASWRRARGRR
ncbi:DNA-processing protein DprA, partial [Actinomyces ruminis]|uniref:DNA-processing protein DprA n=1 Tax=Actinomyces ruminis TaxID=1937003 RepID=UPI000B727C75